MDAVKAEFGGEGKSLYEILEILPTATPAEIKKAYFKLALKYHPDKCPGDKAATARFQALSLVHSVLSDPERRTLYDESGEVAEDGQDESTEEADLWSDYWRNLFPKITVAEIKSFGKKYQGSDEEAKDVLEAYKKCKGKMVAVIDSVMLATEADEDRFRAAIDLAIEREKVPAFSAFRKGTKPASSKSAAKRKAKMDKEAAEAEELLAKIKGRNTDRTSATALSSHRSRQFDSMVSSLEERYGGEKAGGGSRKKGGKESKRAKKAPAPDMDDDEFERIQREMMEGRSKP